MDTSELEKDLHLKPLSGKKLEGFSDEERGKKEEEEKKAEPLKTKKTSKKSSKKPAESKKAEDNRMDIEKKATPIENPQPTNKTTELSMSDLPRNPLPTLVQQPFPMIPGGIGGFATSLLAKYNTSMMPSYPMMTSARNPEPMSSQNAGPSENATGNGHKASTQPAGTEESQPKPSKTDVNAISKESGNKSLNKSDKNEVELFEIQEEVQPEKETADETKASKANAADHGETSKDDKEKNETETKKADDATNAVLKDGGVVSLAIRKKAGVKFSKFLFFRFKVPLPEAQNLAAILEKITLDTFGVTEGEYKQACKGFLRLIKVVFSRSDCFLIYFPFEVNYFTLDELNKMTSAKLGSLRDKLLTYEGEGDE